MSAAAVTSSAALLAATLSLLGTLYVGRRSRGAGIRLAEFQEELSEIVLQRQLCLGLGSRALLVGERAGELRNGIASLAELPVADREAELRRRRDRLDLACDGLVERWVEMAGREIGTLRLGRLIDELSNALEASRLSVIVEGDIARQSLLLRDVDCVARSISAECGEISRALGTPTI